MVTIFMLTYISVARIQILNLMQVVVSNAGSYYEFNRLAYNASWASVASSYVDLVDPIYKDPVRVH